MAKTHQPVDSKLANACVQNYHAIFKATADRRVLDAFTSDVVFDRGQLIAWLNTLTTDSVKISIGVYTPEFVAQYPGAKVNRLTTFITPCNAHPSKVLGAPNPVDDGSGDGSSPFNLGDLTP